MTPATPRLTYGRHAGKRPCEVPTSALRWLRVFDLSGDRLRKEIRDVLNRRGER